MAEAFDAPEIGGDHFRSSAVFLTQSHPKQTQGSDLYVGTSLDQLYAQARRPDTPIPSMQLCIENLDQAGGCYLQLRLRLHRHDQLGDAERAAADDPRSARRVRHAVRRRQQRQPSAPPAARRAEHPRLDRRAKSSASASARSAPAIASASTSTWTDIRELERRIQAVEARNSQRRSARAARRAGRRARFVRRAHEADVRLPGAGVPVRHDARLLVQDGPRRVEPRLPGERHEQAVPPGVAPRRPRSGDPGLQHDQQVPRQHAAVLPRQAEEHAWKATATCSTRR